MNCLYWEGAVVPGLVGGGVGGPNSDPAALDPAVGSPVQVPTASHAIFQFALYGQGLSQGDDGSGSLAHYDYVFYSNSATMSLEGCESACVALNEESGGKIAGYTHEGSLSSEHSSTCMCYFGEEYLTSTVPGSGNCPLAAETCYTSGQAQGPITSLIIDLKYATYINNEYVQITQSTIVASGEFCQTIDTYFFRISA